MTPEERKAKDAARKREAYARRKAALSSKKTPQELATPETDERWRAILTDGKLISAEDIVDYVDSRDNAEGNATLQPFPPGVLYQDHREQVRAIQAESTARAEYVQLLFSKYEKNTNIPQLLQGLIKEQIETRIVMIDLLGEILKGVSR